MNVGLPDRVRRRSVLAEPAAMSRQYQGGSMTEAAAPIRPISADSHIVEPPNCFVDYIDPAYRERAPRLIDHVESGGDKYLIEGLPRPIGLNSLAAAGKN